MPGYLLLSAIVASLLLFWAVRSRKNRPRAWRIVAVSSLLIFGALMAGGLVITRRSEVEAAPTPTLRPTPVRTANATRGDLSDTRQYLGRVLPWQTVALSSQITSRILRLEVREGDPIREGQILVLLDDEEIESAIAGVEAQIAEAEARVAAQEAMVGSLEKTEQYRKGELERSMHLVERGALAQAAADADAERFQEARGKLEAGLSTLEALGRQTEVLRHRLRELKSRRDYTQIRSPFDGVVAERRVDPGDLAVTGDPLVIIEDHSRLRVAFDVPQGEMEKIEKGTTVHLVDRDLELRVDRLHPSLNPDRTRTMEANALPASGLRPGTFQSVEVVIARLENVTLVPESALVPLPESGDAVFTVANGTTRSVPVRRLLVRDGIAAVEGVKPGTAVVLSTYLGWNRLSEGELVEVIP